LNSSQQATVVGSTKAWQTRRWRDCALSASLCGANGLKETMRERERGNVDVNKGE